MDVPDDGSEPLIIPGLSSASRARLAVLAGRTARTPEEEAGILLEAVLAWGDDDSIGLATLARTLVAPFGGFELELPVRELHARTGCFEDGIADGLRDPA